MNGSWGGRRLRVALLLAGGELLLRLAAAWAGLQPDSNPPLSVSAAARLDECPQALVVPQLALDAGKIIAAHDTATVS